MPNADPGSLLSCCMHGSFLSLGMKPGRSCVIQNSQSTKSTKNIIHSFFEVTLERFDMLNTYEMISDR